MAKFCRTCRWTAWTLIIALAACGDNATHSSGLPISAPSSSDPAPRVSGVAAAAPTLVLTTAIGWGDLHIPPGITPPSGKGYSLILRGENFPRDWAGTAYIHGTFLDGYDRLPAYGSGRGPDGSYDMRGSWDCPSGLREAWAEIRSEGRSFESKHIVPAC